RACIRLRVAVRPESDAVARREHGRGFAAHLPDDEVVLVVREAEAEVELAAIDALQAEAMDRVLAGAADFLPPHRLIGRDDDGLDAAPERPAPAEHERGATDRQLLAAAGAHRFPEQHDAGDEKERVKG